MRMRNIKYFMVGRRRRRSEEAPVCKGEVWRSMFYWLEEEDEEGEEEV